MSIILVLVALTVASGKCLTNEMYRNMLDERFLMEDKLVKLDARIREIEDIERITEDRLSFLKQQEGYAISKRAIKDLKKQEKRVVADLVASKFKKDHILRMLRKTLMNVPLRAREEIVRSAHLENRMDQIMSPLERADKMVDKILHETFKGKKNNKSK
ncbi:hypothetical protein EIN_487940 [Entamoeba invadens IP1]|uniref:Uncharacterized protein n=1 Tax=Entamoeba invadens IP1 TaxID=370355 RepID=A0A0A1U4T6_ENTIV|nr:hypothetical protein EIN_487940 [Entamoeba invadens IP1]ELP89282.1 hypothetical protein EIN_487940 [Entamoeba invadens IP1]|eukprot:XP_004256053.1 hypothetical protein EIN_487940 [Entamoeba invadens IP1]